MNSLLLSVRMRMMLMSNFPGKRQLMEQNTYALASNDLIGCVQLSLPIDSKVQWMIHG